MRPAPAQQSQQPLTASPAAELEDGAAAPLLSAYPDQRPDARRQREIQALANQHTARFPGALPAVQFRLAGGGGGEDAAEPAPVIQHSSYSPIQRQVASASAQSVADMSLDEKWGIVYENAIQGAGSGMVMAMMMILGLILLLGAVVAAVAFLAPEFAAAWAAVLAETTILGASLGTWITATLTALGLSASLTAIVNEFRTVNTAINNAQTVGDLQSAGRDWGYNTAEAIAEIIVIILAHASVRSIVARLERDIARRFRGRFRGRRGSGGGAVPTSEPVATPEPAPTAPEPTPTTVETVLSGNTTIFTHQINRGGLDDIISNQRLLSTEARDLAGGSSSVRATVSQPSEWAVPPGATSHSSGITKPMLQFTTEMTPRPIGDPRIPNFVSWDIPEGEFLPIRIYRILFPDGSIVYPNGQ